VARDQAHDILLLMRGKVSEEAITNVMEAWIREADFAYSRSTSSSFSRLVIQHDMGAVVGLSCDHNRGGLLLGGA
jgi:hypothetical protein